VPGKVPTPLIDNEPGPVHGRPVSGFVPVVLVRFPVGVAGETVSSDRAGKIVLCPLSTGLTVLPLSIGLLVFCASAAVAVLRIKMVRPISSMRFAVMWAPIFARTLNGRCNANDLRDCWKGQASWLPAASRRPGQSRS
jgi:hypothetical protein